MTAPGPADRIGQVPCMNCGARDVAVTRQGWVEGLRDWIRFGGPWLSSRRLCRRCGGTSGAGSFGMVRPSRRGWWWVPVGLFQTLRQRRAMVPVPATYLVATVVGAGLGVAAQLVLGWPWWLLAAAVVVAVWLFFFSTALWGGGGWSQPLASDLLRVVRPGRALARDHRQLLERLRAAPIRLYGLPASWAGPRYLAGWEGSVSKGQRPVITALSLGHGDPLAGDGPQLRVEVSVERAGPRQRRGLAEDLWVQAAPQPHSAAAGWDRIAAARSRPDPAWSRVTIPVDGRPVAFAWLGEGRHWVAWAELDDRTLTLHGRDLPVGSVELTGVTDLEPFLEGTRRLEQAWARHRQEDS